MEFLFPVKFSGVRHIRVTADTFDAAVEKCHREAEVKANYELNLSEAHYDVLVPRLMLTDEELKTWPCWGYGYSGTDGVDWRTGYTREGRASVPDFAEEVYPVPKDWIASWRE